MLGLSLCLMMHTHHYNIMRSVAALKSLCFCYSHLHLPSLATYH